MHGHGGYTYGVARTFPAVFDTGWGRDARDEAILTVRLVSLYLAVDTTSMVLLWCYCSVTMVLLLCYCGVTTVLQWCFDRALMVSLWCHFSAATRVTILTVRLLPLHFQNLANACKHKRKALNQNV